MLHAEKTRAALRRRVFRRGGALFLATLGIWLLGLNRGAAGEALDALEASPAFLSAVLCTELGRRGTGETLSLWDRLVLSQSPYLPKALPGTAETPAPAPSSAPLPDAQPARDHDDLTAPPASTAAPENIVPRTLIPTGTSGYTVAGGLYLYNRTSLSVDLAALAAAPLEITLPAQGPEILIMHTHATEAYTPDGTDTYTASGDCRTLDEKQNMIRVGDEMEKVFTEMGLRVVHDPLGGRGGGISHKVPLHPHRPGRPPGRPHRGGRHDLQGRHRRGRGADGPGHAGAGQQRGG